MSLHQCEAIKPGGSRCGRTTRPGERYCYSHRNYKPKVREPLPPGNRVMEHLFDCADCGRLIPVRDEMRPNWKTGEILCEPCYRLRRQIEDRIMEILDAAPNHTLRVKDIYADLARFGVDQDLVDAARRRMYADGRLFNPHVEGDA